jgi:exosortase
VSPAWIVVNVVLVGLLFAGRFVQLVGVWVRDPNYSHGFLVPLVSGWLAWRYWRQAGVPARADGGPGLAALASGCLLHLAALVTGWALLDFLALALVLRGFAVSLGGRVWARGFTFPILFLFFMFPLPGLCTTAAALWLQGMVSGASAAVLNLFTICYQRGHALHLSGMSQPLVVAAECSGLRQILAFVALGAVVGHLSRQSWLWRTLLIIAALPVALLANIARVLVMAIGASVFGTEWLSGWLHTTPALLTLPLGLVLFVLVIWALGPGRGLEGKA